MKVPIALLALAMVATAFAGCTTPSGSTDTPDSGNGDPPGDPGAALKPVFSFKASDSDPLAFTFDGTGSNGPVQEWRWDFGDGETGSGKVVPHTYKATNGGYKATLTVVDAAGKMVSDRKIVKVGDLTNKPPVPTFTINSHWLKTTDPFVVNASGTTDGDNDPLTYTWYYSVMAPAGGGHHHDAGTAVGAPAVPPPSTTLGSLNSGALATDKSWQFKFDQVGVYLMHCHPHPTMKHNLTVSSTATLGGTAYVDIYDGYFAPENLAVKPGTTVVYTNRGVAEHTATQEGFRTLAGTGMGATFTIPKASAYDVILSVRDAKGTVREASTPVISATQLPDPTFSDQVKDTFTVAAGDQAKKAIPFTLKYNASTLTVNLTYGSTVPGLNVLSLKLFKSDISGEPLATGAPADGTAQSLQVGPLEAGSYIAYVEGKQGANVEFTVDLLAQYVLEPRPEDFAMATPMPADDHSGHSH